MNESGSLEYGKEMKFAPTHIKIGCILCTCHEIQSGNPCSVAAILSTVVAQQLPVIHGLIMGCFALPYDLISLLI